MREYNITFLNREQHLDATQLDVEKNADEAVELGELFTLLMSLADELEIEQVLSIEACDNICGYAEPYTYTAGVFCDNGFGYIDMSTYDDMTEAINFARNRHWDEVVCDQTGEIVWSGGDR